jgi:hypothetical protein
MRLQATALLRGNRDGVVAARPAASASVAGVIDDVNGENSTCNRLTVQGRLEAAVLRLVRRAAGSQELVLVGVHEKQLVGQVIHQVQNVVQRSVGLAGNFLRGMSTIKKMQKRDVGGVQLKDLPPGRIVEEQVLVGPDPLEVKT